MTAKTIIVVALIVAAAATIFLQHQDKRALVQELAAVRAESAQFETLQAAPHAIQPSAENGHAEAGDTPSELLRLRGAASRATRAEAEVAQLRRELQQYRQ